MNARRRYSIDGLTEPQVRVIQHAIVLAETIAEHDGPDTSLNLGVITRARAAIERTMIREGIEP